jgi:hypothetical protein
LSANVLLLVFFVIHLFVAFVALVLSRRIGFPGLGFAAATLLLGLGFSDAEFRVTELAIQVLVHPHGFNADSASVALRAALFPAWLGLGCAIVVGVVHLFVWRRRREVGWKNPFWIAGVLTGVALLLISLMSSATFIHSHFSASCVDFRIDYQYVPNVYMFPVWSALVAEVSGFLGGILCAAFGMLGWWWDHRMEIRLDRVVEFQE